LSVLLDVEGLSIGHHSDPVGRTGCTVILAPEGVVASVDIRGGAPGSLDTDLLSPYASVSELHGLVLTGGSAPGLGAAGGVTAFLRDKGLGYKTAFARIPLVSGAVIYDLGLGSPEACPSPEDGRRAASAAWSALEAAGGAGGVMVEEGSVGVGTGATVGKLLGAGRLMKGGVALAKVMIADAVAVWALSVVNAVGDVIDEHGAVLAGAQDDGVFLDSRRLLLAMSGPPRLSTVENTTLSVVMTDARLDKAQCATVARMSHDGMARAISPVHTPVDGDCVFVLATGRRSSNVFQVGAAAAEAVAASIRRAVRAAEGCPGAPALRDLHPTAASSC
jgi:L-aminopeptidase/D-esterase-like protein